MAACFCARWAKNALALTGEVGRWGGWGALESLDSQVRLFFEKAGCFLFLSTEAFKVFNAHYESSQRGVYLAWTQNYDQKTAGAYVMPHDDGDNAYTLRPTCRSSCVRERRW